MRLTKMLAVYALYITVFLLMGANWPDNLHVQSGAGYERTRVLFYQEPNLTGADVVELQERLQELGFFTGKINGIYDSKVEQAVRDFQRDNGLAPDGIVKEHVWIRLADNELPVNKSPKLKPPTGEVQIIVDTFKLRLIVLNDNEPCKIFPIAIGRTSTPTPIGNFKVIHKAANWGDGFGTRWLGLNVPWGKFGIHGTNKPWSIGRMASHGCIRMRNSDVEMLYPWVKYGTEVTIVGNPFGRLSSNHRKLIKGSRGSDVVAVQEKLIKLGYLKGKADGVFGYGTESSVKKFQKDCKLKVTGQIDWWEYKKLNL